LSRPSERVHHMRAIATRRKKRYYKNAHAYICVFGDLPIIEFQLELIQTKMAQKPVLRAEV
jgi:hypothetical protein